MIGQTNAKIGSKINGTVEQFVANETIAKGDFVRFIGYNDSSNTVVSNQLVEEVVNRQAITPTLTNVQSFAGDFQVSETLAYRISAVSSHIYIAKMEISSGSLTFTDNYQDLGHSLTINNVGVYYKQLDSTRFMIITSGGSGIYGILLTYSSGTFSITTTTLLSTITNTLSAVKESIYDHIYLCVINYGSYLMAIKIDNTTFTSGTALSGSTSKPCVYVDKTNSIMRWINRYLSGGNIVFQSQSISINTSTLAITLGTLKGHTGVVAPSDATFIIVDYFQKDKYIYIIDRIQSYSTNSRYALGCIYSFNVDGSVNIHKTGIELGANIGSSSYTSTDIYRNYTPAERLNEYWRERNNVYYSHISIKGTYNVVSLKGFSYLLNHIPNLVNDITVNLWSTDTYTQYTPSFIGNKYIVALSTGGCYLYETKMVNDGVAKSGGSAGETIKVFMPE